MNFKSQIDSLNQLQTLCNSDRHSILIEGPEGCGKTYLSHEYQNMLDVYDYQLVNPNVQDIRDAVESCIQLNNKIVLCIENLDKGVAAASYTLLKFLEEPASNVYIVVTCRNLNLIPDTIISRSTVVSVPPPLDCDIDLFAQSKHSVRYEKLRTKPIWSCVRTFKDANTVLMMTDDQLDYFNSLTKDSVTRDSVSNVMWKLGHYADNSEAPVELVIRYVIGVCNNSFIERCGIECIKDITQGRIASHAALAKFCFDVKYCE